MLEWLEAHQFPCLFREIWGMDCPGCGFQTAVLLLLQGDLKSAVVTWPGLLPLLVFILLIIAKICGMKKISPGMLKNVGLACLMTIFVAYVFRLICV